MVRFREENIVLKHASGVEQSLLNNHVAWVTDFNFAGLRDVDLELDTVHTILVWFEVVIAILVVDPSVGGVLQQV